MPVEVLTATAGEVSLAAPAEAVQPAMSVDTLLVLRSVSLVTPRCALLKRNAGQLIPVEVAPAAGGGVPSPTPEPPAVAVTATKLARTMAAATGTLNAAWRLRWTWTRFIGASSR